MPATPGSALAAGGAAETLPVFIHASARWDDITRDEKGNDLQRNSGFLSFTVSGTMVLKDSPVVTKGSHVMMPLENYAPENLAVSACYDERTEDLRPPKERSCKNPLISSYQGNHFGTITDGPSLTVCNFSSAAAPFVQNPMMTDFYQFATGGGDPVNASGKSRIRGVRRTSKCAFVDAEKNFPGFSFGLQMKMPASGSMSGFRSWTADTDGLTPPSFAIRVSDMGSPGQAKAFKPPEGGRRNVTYSVSWNFGGERENLGKTSEDDEKTNCENLRERVNFISVVMAAYSNPSIRNTVKNLGFDLSSGMKLYQQAVENAVLDAINNNSGLGSQLSDAFNVDGERVVPHESTESAGDVKDIWDKDSPLCQSEALEKKEAQANMETRARGNLDGGLNEWGHPLGSSTIVDLCSGSAVTIEVVDRNGKPAFNQEVHNAVACWQGKYGDQAGKARFESSLEHERTHVDQYTKRGRIRSVDDMAERELEAYQKEMEMLQKAMDELGC